MKINVKVIPGAKKNSIKQEAGWDKVYLTAPAVDGKANKSLIEFLAKSYGVKKSQVFIIKGLKSRQKTISIKN